MKKFTICLVLLFVFVVSASLCHAQQKQPIVYFKNGTDKEIVLIISRYRTKDNERFVDGYARIPAGQSNGWSKFDGDFYFYVGSGKKLAQFKGYSHAFYWAHETENFFATINGNRHASTPYSNDKYKAAYGNRPKNIKWGRPKGQNGYSNSQDLDAYFKPEDLLKDYGFVVHKFYKAPVTDKDITITIYHSNFD